MSKDEPSSRVAFRVALPSYLACRPLIEGLAGREDVRVEFAPPVALAALLRAGHADAALVPPIDLHRPGEPLVVLPAGCLASCGPSLTARVYLRIPAHQVRILWADDELHSEPALARVLWRELFGRRLAGVPFDAGRTSPPESAEAVLLAGDRAVTDPPLGFYVQMDPCELWFEATGLPFVHGVWAARADRDTRRLCDLLTRARDRGLRRLETIARQTGRRLGWPADLATRCLCEQMDYDFSDACEDGMEEFFQFARRAGVIGCLRDVRVREG